MDRNNKEMILSLIKIIMSSESIEEQHTKALQLLQSSPDMLLSLLKMNVDLSTNHERSDTTSSHVLSTHGKDSFYPTNTNPAQNAQQHLEVIQKKPIGVEFNTTTHLKINQTKEQKYAEEKRNLSSNISRKRKKTIQAMDNERLCKSKVKNKWEMHTEDDNLQDHSCMFVRELINILYMSQHHQDAVLTILRASKNLRKLFFKEKAKLGNEMIPIFKCGMTSQSFNNHTFCSIDNPQSDPSLQSCLLPSQSDVQVPVSLLHEDITTSTLEYDGPLEEDKEDMFYLL